jgi:hypothetical protein
MFCQCRLINKINSIFRKCLIKLTVIRRRLKTSSITLNASKNFSPKSRKPLKIIMILKSIKIIQIIILITISIMIAKIIIIILLITIIAKLTVLAIISIILLTII